MSLDIKLYESKKLECSCGIVHNVPTGYTSYETNITHNLNNMAEAVGIYMYLWRPEEIEVKQASELIKPLQDGIKELERYPEKYNAYSASNGWGTYEQFIPWLKQLLKACEENPLFL